MSHPVADDRAADPGDGRAADEAAAEGAEGGVGAAPRPVEIEPRSLVFLVCGFLIVLLVSLTTLLPSGFVVISPGPVVNTLGAPAGHPLISVSGRTTYPTSGTLDLTTVVLDGGPNTRVSVFAALAGWLDDSKEVLPSEAVIDPKATEKQTEDLNRAEMADSQQSATAAALHTLGIGYTTTLTVQQVVARAPAHTVLASGDVLSAINGRPIVDLAGLHAALRAVHPGDPVTLEVRRGGAVRRFEVRTVRGGDGSTLLGVMLSAAYGFPFTVKIQIGNVGGPSAGTMFALGIIDRLTPGDLTGGQPIAGTGTIDSGGTVGPIGGIRQKLIGARRAGARWFLAPADNCSDVVHHVPRGLRVVRVATLGEALSDVRAIAAGHGASLPSC